jgi:hypothetical protein
MLKVERERVGRRGEEEQEYEDASNYGRKVYLCFRSVKSYY